MHDPQHHVSLTHNIRNIHVTGMRASVDNPIHIQIKMIELWKERRISDDLIDLWISLTDPSIKLKVGTKNGKELEIWFKLCECEAGIEEGKQVSFYNSKKYHIS